MEPLDKNFKPQGEPVAEVHDHEHSDINVRGIWAFVIFLAVSGLIIHVLLFGALAYMEKRYEDTENARRASMPMTRMTQDEQKRLADENMRQRIQLPGPAQSSATRFEQEMHQNLERQIATFPEPRVQQDDVYDMTVYRYATDVRLNCGQLPQNAKLHAAEKGEAPQHPRVPGCMTIDEAMERVAKEGLPTMNAAIPTSRSTTGGNIALPSRSSTHHRKSVNATNTYAQTLVVPTVPVVPPPSTTDYASDVKGQQVVRPWDRGIQPEDMHKPKKPQGQGSQQSTTQGQHSERQ